MSDFTIHKDEARRQRYINNMDHFNLLDLDNDVLNIIGNYVKKDNHDRMEKEEDFKIVNNFFCFGILIYIRLIIFFIYNNFL